MKATSELPPRPARLDAIVDTAATLFATRGYHATGISELSAAAGLGRGALYHYIGSKERLLYEVSARHVARMVRYGAEVVNADMPPVQKLAQLSTGLMRIIAEESAPITVFFREFHNLSGQLREDLMQLRDQYEYLWCRVLAEGVATGAFALDDPLVVKTLLGMHNYGYVWFDASGPVTPAELSKIFVGVARRGILVESLRPLALRELAASPGPPTVRPASATPESSTRFNSILVAATQLFAQRGYHATGISDIEKVVGLGRGALYHHIGSKEKLLYEIMSRHVRRMIEVGEEVCSSSRGPIERLAALSQGLMGAIAESKAEVTIFHREFDLLEPAVRAELVALRDRYERIWRQLLKDGVASGHFRTDDPLVVEGLLGMHNYSYVWLDPAGPRSPAEIAELFSRVMLVGIEGQ